MNVPDDDLSDILDMLESAEAAPPEPAPASKPAPVKVAQRRSYDDGDDPASFYADTGLKVEREVPDITKPWMRFHDFVLVKTPEEVEVIVDEALACGHVSLDLETEGLDNRIVYDEAGKPRTVHQIVGFCLSVGDAKKGYYIPVRHAPNDGGPDLNVKPLARVEAAITRLCQAAQPTPKPGHTDPLAFKEHETPPRVVIDFWNAKFDQEFLYPVTGIDFWHPDSFEDGNLAYFTLYSGDKHLGLKPKAEEVLRSPEGHPYEMIELKELFPNKRKILFSSLSPDEPGVVKYAGSDAICTRLLCGRPDLLPVIAKDPGKAFTYRLEKQVAQVVRVMERNRVKVDRSKLQELRDKHRTVREEYRAKIIALAASKGFENFEPGSPKQLSDFLFGERGLNINPKPPLNEKSGQYKTDYDSMHLLTEELGENAPEIIKWIMAYREEDKVLGTYLESLAVNPDLNNELRFQFKQTGAATGRFSAPAGDNDQGFSGIPIHGIPATSDLRTCFVARPGYTMVKCDYAGEELRIVTNLSNEPVWIKEFQEGDGDLHSITARAFFNKQEVTKEERKMGKCVHPDTLVLLDGRLAPVGSLPFSPASDSFLPSTESRAVHDGQAYREVAATYNGGVKPLVHVVSTGGLLTCTPEHRFKMRDGSFVRAGDLCEGDLLEVPVVPEMREVPYEDAHLSLWEGIPKSRYTLSHDLAYFAGLYAGDGSGNASSACLTHGDVDKTDAYGNPYETWVETLEDAAKRCGFTTTRRDGKNLYLGNRVFVRLLSDLGLQRKRRKNLRVPSWVLASGRTSFLHYLAGLVDTDGTVGAKTPSLDWTTKDFVLAGQVTTAMRACGLDFHVEVTFNQTYQRHYVRVRLTVESSWAMQPYLRHRGKVARLRAPIYEGRTADRYVVRKVLLAGEGPCLDLTVEPTHVYLANGLVTHNTANFALVYGGGPASIMRASGCNKLEAQRRKQSFDKAVPTFANWVKGQHERVKKQLGVYTAFGRWIAIPDANAQLNEKDSNGRTLVTEDDVRSLRAACERHATNYPIQGCLNRCSVVLTDHGYKTIGDLEANGTEGLRVWTGTKWATFTTHNMGRWQLADVTLADGTLIQCDTRHKLLVVTDEGYSWVEYADLKPGDRIATSLCEPVEMMPPPLPPVVAQTHARNHPQVDGTVDLWYWLGRYMGDGWIDPRGGLTFSFGEHERAAIDACVAFWQSRGLNPQVTWATHTPDVKTSTRARVEVWSVELARWLNTLGFVPATAHTKRLPARLFRETLENRRAFMRGFMDSDGHKPPLDTAKGNPYNLHLCQRELLADTKLLLRTLGVESCLRGPYRSTNGEGRETTSYRLDIQRRMYERRVMERTDLRHAKFHDMFAPAFLVRDLLSKGAWERKDFPDESLHVMYSRLKAGGKVSVYTLDRLCQALGVTLDHPIYGFKRLVSKIERVEEDDTFTLSVHDPLHRFEAEGVITKNSGADIMKIAMVLLHKEFHRRGWLRHQSDAVRMLLTVHDEIVFEVRHDLVFEAIPVLTEEMEKPTKIARPPYSPKWKVPLVTEPLLGESWGAEYSCHRAKPDENPTEGGFVAYGYVYGKVPEAIRPFIPGGGAVMPEAPASAPESVKPEPVATTPVVAAAVAPSPTKTTERVAVSTIRLSMLTARSVSQVRGLVAEHMTSRGTYLRLLDKFGTTVLIDPSLKLRVNAQKLAQALLEKNLSDGKVSEETT